MKLHQNIKLFRQAIQFTSDQMKIPTIYVEKDYWVTYALYTIYNDEIGKDTVFKGGTALSKCFNVIDRFSEDIDLVVLRKDSDSNNQLTNKIKKISKVVKNVLPEVMIEGLTQKKGMNRKTAHVYTKEFQGHFGQVRDTIVIEATWLGHYEPYVKKEVSPFVGEIMIKHSQLDIAKEYNLLPFEVLVLEPTRTICEKIMSLVRFSYTKEPVEDLKKKIRHLYDLHLLLTQKEFSEFFESSGFDEMLLKVANDDAGSYKNNNDWLKHHPCEALIFKNPSQIWLLLKTAYQKEFKNLVYGDFPTEIQLLGTLHRLKKRVTTVQWKLHLFHQNET